MNMMVRETLVPVNTGEEELNARLEMIAQAIERHDLKNLGGIERIEHLHAAAVDELPIAGTIFASINEVLGQLNIATDETVGGVMKELGFARESDEAAMAAHEIGCYCHGEYISPPMAAQRIRNLKSA